MLSVLRLGATAVPCCLAVPPPPPELWRRLFAPFLCAATAVVEVVVEVVVEAGTLEEEVELPRGANMCSRLGFLIP